MKTIIEIGASLFIAIFFMSIWLCIFSFSDHDASIKNKIPIINLITDEKSAAAIIVLLVCFLSECF